MSAANAGLLPFVRSVSRPWIWGISDGAAGHGSQIRGLCEELGGTARYFECALRFPWKQLPVSWIAPGPNVFTNPAELEATPPDVVVSCGRQAAAASLWLKQRHGARIFTIHLQNPQADVRLFDLVAAPEHDQLAGDNVLSTRGALHPLSPRKLSVEAKSGPIAGLDRLGQEFVAVLLGGPNKYYPFSEQDVTGLVARLKRLAASGRRLAIIPSRRTPQHAVDACVAALGTTEFVWTGETENPYRSAMALASHIVVTSDSVSMISEAAATGRPVHVEFLSERRYARKFARFHQAFLDQGMIRPFVGNVDNWKYEPVYEAKRIADEVLQRLPSSSLQRRAA